MAFVITTSSAFKTLKATLDNIITDKSDGYEKRAVFKRYTKQQTMEDNFVDDLENGGPGLATETTEGTPLQVGSLLEGYITRYTSRKFGLIMQITEEIDEDGKYNDKYIDAARRLKRALFKSKEIDCAQMLNRATNTLFVGGDGLPLASAAHTIPGGGTFSNQLAASVSPSNGALISVAQNLMVLPGHDGVTEGYMPKMIVCPPAQAGSWMTILASRLISTSANNDVNISADFGFDSAPVAVPYWTASAVNWMATTDAADLLFKTRRKARARTWYDETTEVINHGVSERWARGWSDPRATYWGNTA